MSIEEFQKLINQCMSLQARLDYLVARSADEKTYSDLQEISRLEIQLDKSLSHLERILRDVACLVEV